MHKPPFFGNIRQATASLPVKEGGVGVRRITSLAPLRPPPVPQHYTSSSYTAARRLPQLTHQ